MTLQEPILSDWREGGREGERRVGEGERRVGEGEGREGERRVGEGEGREEWRERGRKGRGRDRESITFASNFLIV